MNSSPSEQHSTYSAKNLFAGVIVMHTNIGHTIIQAPNASMIPQNVLPLQKYFPQLLSYIAANVMSVAKRASYYLINIETGGIPAFIPPDRILELVRTYEREQMTNIDDSEFAQHDDSSHSTEQHQDESTQQLTQQMQQQQFFADPQSSAIQQHFQQQQYPYGPNTAAPQHLFAAQHAFYPPPPQYFAHQYPYTSPTTPYPLDAPPQSGIPINTSPVPPYSPSSSLHSPQSYPGPHPHQQPPSWRNHYRSERRRSLGGGFKPKYQSRGGGFHKYPKRSKSDRPKSGIEIEDEYLMSGALFYTFRSGKVSLLLQKRIQWEKEQKESKNIWLHFCAPRDNDIDVDSVSTIARAFTHDTCGALARRNIEQAAKDLEIILRNPQHNESIYVEDLLYNVHLCHLDARLFSEKEINATLKEQFDNDVNKTSSDRCTEVAWFDLDTLLKKVKASRNDQPVSGLRYDYSDDTLSQVTKGLLAQPLINERLRDIIYSATGESKNYRNSGSVSSGTGNGSSTHKKSWKGTRGGANYRGGSKRGGYSSSGNTSRNSPGFVDGDSFPTLSSTHQPSQKSTEKSAKQQTAATESTQ